MRLRKWNRISEVLIYMDLLSGEKKKMLYVQDFILRMKVVQEISPYIRHFQEWSWSIMICIWNIVIRCRVHVLDLLKLIIVGRGGVSVRLESAV